MSTDMKSTLEGRVSLTQFAGPASEGGSTRLQLTVPGERAEFGWVQLTRDDAAALALDLLKWSQAKLETEF